jgi:hypothetical protein
MSKRHTPLAAIGSRAIQMRDAAAMRRAWRGVTASMARSLLARVFTSMKAVTSPRLMMRSTSPGPDLNLSLRSL